jgi:hypothetical protein
MDAYSMTAAFMDSSIYRDRASNQSNDNTRLKKHHWVRQLKLKVSQAGSYGDKHDESKHLKESHHYTMRGGADHGATGDHGAMGDLSISWRLFLDDFSYFYRWQNRFGNSLSRLVLKFSFKQGVEFGQFRPVYRFGS